MKLTLEAIDLEEAIKNYLKNTYSLYGEIEVQEVNDIEVIIKPREYTSSIKTGTEYSSDVPIDVEYDTTREDAIGRADHLGIKYRADISTDKLIERIEEYELEMHSENKYSNDGNELPLENDVDTVVESDEPLEEEADETIQEVQEEQPQKKKKSIFDKPE